MVSLRLCLQLCSTNFRRLLSPVSIGRKISVEASSFPGHNVPFTTKLEAIRPELLPRTPVYQVLSKEGALISPENKPEVDKELALKMFTNMVTLSAVDKVMYESQRQGRISFYLTNYGEEAIHVGSAAALDPLDFIYGQYREVGVLLYRGFTLEQLMDQCYSNVGDTNKGRQMPVHYGSKELNFSTISSPLATQIPIATGSAYSFKLAGNGKVVVCYFGEGAASEGDAFAGMNFSATLECPVIFVCRNNGYAISTPVHEQYRGDGVVARAPALGMLGLRVDGNDVFAIYNATKFARQLCTIECRPVLIEAMTYRVGHHSTSDDSSAYRAVDEVSYWEKTDNPILRLRNYLFNQNWLTEQEEKDLRTKLRKEVVQCFARSEAKKKPNPLLMFSDVYAKMPPRLKRQMMETKEHLRKHAAEFDLDAFEPVALVE